MKCAMCGRPLFRQALMVGKCAFGPKCARKAGLEFSKAKVIGQVRHRVVADKLTRDLFEGVPA